MLSAFFDREDQGEVTRAPRTLSGIGAIIYSVLLCASCILSALCLRTDAAGAVYSLLAVVFFCAGLYVISALLTHGKEKHMLISLVLSFAGAYLLTADILRSLLGVTVFAVPLIISYTTARRRFTYTGNVCIAAAATGGCFILMLCSLAYFKYGELSLGVLVRAYESFCNIILAAPRETLAFFEAEGGEQMAAFTEQYRTLVRTLEELLSVMLYSLPSMFMSVCAICGFVCVFSVKRYRRMAGLEDTVGAFELSSVSAVLYIILNLIALFIDPITPFGIAIVSISAPMELGLALYGAAYGLKWIKKNGKSQMYYVIPIMIAVMLPSVCVSLLAYLGAYRTVFLDRLRRLSQKDSDKVD